MSRSPSRALLSSLAQVVAMSSSLVPPTHAPIVVEACGGLLNVAVAVQRKACLGMLGRLHVLHEMTKLRLHFSTPQAFSSMLWQLQLLWRCAIHTRTSETRVQRS